MPSKTIIERHKPRKATILFLYPNIALKSRCVVRGTKAVMSPGVFFYGCFSIVLYSSVLLPPVHANSLPRHETLLI